jgi:FlaA1/EpsC-like NDP-sugar epimerase
MPLDWRDELNATLRRLSCVLVDAAVMAAAYLSAFLLRFDFQMPWWGWKRVAFSFVSVFLAQVLALTLFGCYRLVWRYVSVGDVPRFVGASLIHGVVVLLRSCCPEVRALGPLQHHVL